MWEWLDRLLSYFWWNTKKYNVLFLGLDNAGKTTLMHRLSDNRLVVHEPTQKPTSETFELGNVTFRVTDMGGHESARAIWHEYGMQADGVFFMVDARARDRFDEARAVLNIIMQDEAMAGKPFVILGNKIDKGDAVSESELRQQLMLPATTGKDTKVDDIGENDQPVEIFMCSVVNSTGYGDAFKWMARFLR